MSNCKKALQKFLKKEILIIDPDSLKQKRTSKTNF